MEKLTMYGNSMRLIEVCVMKSLCIFIAYAYIRTIKRQREFVQQELLISGIFFACFFVVSLFFIILLKQVMLPRILQIAFAVITLLFLGIILLVLWLLNLLFFIISSFIDCGVCKSPTSIIRFPLSVLIPFPGAASVAHEAVSKRG